MILTKEDIIAIFEERGIEYEIVSHKAVYTIDEMLDCGLPDAGRIAKNLFIRDDKKRNYYLIVCLESKRMDLKEFRNAHGTRPLTFASEKDLMAKMGLERGAVTPLGILANEERDIRVFIDREFEEGTIGVHPCDNTATVYLDCRDLAALITEHGNGFEFMEI